VCRKRSNDTLTLKHTVVCDVCKSRTFTSNSSVALSLAVPQLPMDVSVSVAALVTDRMFEQQVHFNCSQSGCHCDRATSHWSADVYPGLLLLYFLCWTPEGHKINTKVDLAFHDFMFNKPKIHPVATCTSAAATSPPALSDSKTIPKQDEPVGL